MDAGTLAAKFQEPQLKKDLDTIAELQIVAQRADSTTRDALQFLQHASYIPEETRASQGWAIGLLHKACWAFTAPDPLALPNGSTVHVHNTHRDGSPEAGYVDLGDRALVTVRAEVGIRDLKQKITVNWKSTGAQDVATTITMMHLLRLGAHIAEALQSNRLTLVQLQEALVSTKE